MKWYNEKKLIKIERLISLCPRYFSELRASRVSLQVYCTCLTYVPVCSLVKLYGAGLYQMRSGKSRLSGYCPLAKFVSSLYTYAWCTCMRHYLTLLLSDCLIVIFEWEGRLVAWSAFVSDMATADATSDLTL